MQLVLNYVGGLAEVKEERKRGRDGGREEGRGRGGGSQRGRSELLNPKSAR